MKIIAVIVIILGIIELASPQTAWYLSYGWRYKNAEPSEAALIIERIGGVIGIILGIILLIIL